MKISKNKRRLINLASAYHKNIDIRYFEQMTENQLRAFCHPDDRDSYWKEYKI